MVQSSAADGSSGTAGKKRREEKRPCYCNNCNGRMRDRHTVAKHTLESKTINGPNRLKEQEQRRPSKKMEKRKGKSKRVATLTEAAASQGGHDTGLPMDIDSGTPAPDDGGILDEEMYQSQSITPVPHPEEPEHLPSFASRDTTPVADVPIQQPPSPSVPESPRRPSVTIEEEEEDDGLDGWEGQDTWEEEAATVGPAAEINAGDELGAPLDDLGGVAGPGEADPTTDEANEPAEPSLIDNVRFSDEFIALIRNATLDNDKLSETTLKALRNPPNTPYRDLSDAERLSLELYLDCDGAAQDVYTRVKHTVEAELPLERFPDGLLSIYRVEKLIETLTGIVSVEDDMCVNGCHAFTGPWADLDSCRVCHKERYLPSRPNSKKSRVPLQQMCTIPLGPQIQALRRSAPGSAAMSYRDHKVREILARLGKGEDIVLDDVFSGSDYIELHQKAGVTPNDTMLGFSVDGAQLYQDKKSDVWIAVWILYDYDPTTRYKRKHVLPALIIPGPEKPKNLDSFLFRTFYHLSALQRENNGRGLKVFDYSQRTVVYSRLFFLFGLADTVGLTELDGRVGHHGAVGCRLGCPLKGRHKPGQGHYYAAHKKPTVPIDPNKGVASDHPDYDYSTIRRSTDAEYEAGLQKVRASCTTEAYFENRKNTGISKPSIISGLVPELCFSPPRCFTVDHMHHFYNNVPVLMVAHWRGTIKCEPTDSKDNWFWVCLTGNNWTAHGLDVANAGQYLPSLFHRIPRNPALKISSSYKCSEYNVYFYKLGRVLFRKYLPKVIWQHYCLLVHAVDILSQRVIEPKQLVEAHTSLVAFVKGYEDLYYQGREDRLHFCRQAIHTLLHTSPEAFRVGPGSNVTQYTLENIIGDLGGEIRQPSNPFGNLKKIALRRCQMNAAKVIYPEVDVDSTVRLPRGAKEVGHGYVFLTPRGPSLKKTSQLGAMGDLIASELGMDQIMQWGRIMLPNGQHIRSAFTESRYTRLTRRVSRMVKLEYKEAREDGTAPATVVRFGEVQFYFLSTTGEPKAMVSLFGPKVERLYTESHSTIWACTYPEAQNPDHLRLCNIEEIITVVSMQPFVKRDDDYDLQGLNLWFVAEKSGLEDTAIFLSIEALNNHLANPT